MFRSVVNYKNSVKIIILLIKEETKMPGNKAKGSKAERELYQLFVENHFRAVRVVNKIIKQGELE